MVAPNIMDWTNILPAIIMNGPIKRSGWFLTKNLMTTSRKPHRYKQNSDLLTNEKEVKEKKHMHLGACVSINNNNTLKFL